MQVTLKNVRLSFNDLFTPRSFEDGGKKTYSATVLVPDDSDQKKMIDKELMKLATEAWKAKAPALFKELTASNKTSCWFSGESKEYDGYEGHWVLKASRQEKNGRPAVVDRKACPLAESDAVIYSGCFVNVTIDLYIQDSSYGKGLRANLLGVQFVKDGTPFTSGSKVAEFEALEEDEDSLV